ncbi:DUF4230 domain-containing protein [Aquimarina sp. ERC-38]|uniref:DUF4230 domain-containing protein n=1 Tax=Aquimarina sp. ERC-38 TaxID=2949996 RepID=UPI002245DE3F|nr:DUF4230 domain-containing protein [Aquimarina sp. ERC-38]UZO81562.1 DUF4230 domain-containing protein [Aquimarina sp. ERC-38]
MELLFTGLAIGAVITFFVFNRFNRAHKKAQIEKQSVVLIEKMRNVCKLIAVEGDFAEIYHYKSVQDKFIKLLIGQKKALILIDAKAHVGFDLTQIKIDSDTESKKIILTHFPQPKLLSIETDFKYYDKREGWLNPFTSSDLTEINREAKQHIIDKVPDSGLLESAKTEALNAIQIMETLASSIGWTLDYNALKQVEVKTPKKLEA